MITENHLIGAKTGAYAFTVLAAGPFFPVRVTVGQGTGRDPHGRWTAFSQLGFSTAREPQNPYFLTLSAYAGRVTRS